MCVGIIYVLGVIVDASAEMSIAELARHIASPFMKVLISKPLSNLTRLGIMVLINHL